VAEAKWEFDQHLVWEGFPTFSHIHLVRWLPSAVIMTNTAAPIFPYSPSGTSRRSRSSVCRNRPNFSATKILRFYCPTRIRSIIDRPAQKRRRPRRLPFLSSLSCRDKWRVSWFNDFISQFSLATKPRPQKLANFIDRLAAPLQCMLRESYHNIFCCTPEKCGG